MLWAQARDIFRLVVGRGMGLTLAGSGRARRLVRAHAALAGL